MLWAAATVFFVVVVIAGIFAFGGVLVGAVLIARFIFFIFLVLLAVTVVLHFRNKMRQTR